MKIRACGKNVDSRAGISPPLIFIYRWETIYRNPTKPIKQRIKKPQSTTRMKAPPA
jgi:hypothetical protein